MKDVDPTVPFDEKVECSIVYSVSCLCGKCLCVLYLMTLNTHFITCVYSNHNAKLSPVQVLYLYSTVGYMLITPVLVHCIDVFSGITLLPLQRQTIPKAVDALVDKELLEKSIQSIVDKQVSVLVRLSQLLNPAHDTVNVYCVFQVYSLVACLFVLVRHIIYITQSLCLYL